MFGIARLHLLSGSLLIISTGILAIGSEDVPASFETVHNSNAAILNRLGLAPLQIPDGHHKKRLAGPEPPGLNSQTRIHQPYSRRHGHRDSHIYIVKLPASPPYYTITKPHKTSKDEKVIKTGSNLPVGFHGNGKPAKIYHWNLPLVKKMTEKKRLQAQLRIDQARKKVEESSKKRQPDFTSVDGVNSVLENPRHQDTDKSKIVPHKVSLPKHTRNNDKRLNYPEMIDKKSDSAKKTMNSLAIKTYRLDDSSMHRIHLSNELHGSRNSLPKMKKHRKKAAMSYYAPISTKSGSTSIHKNFPGNGKPKAFYVMEKSRKPVYYHPLLP
ncbi:hypothetical protein KPH14_008854 [Odynerus spinipes]|uniref:Uncharacterized protein n=1 Tax=Odynerus spinipes TaxID=1348599 RepID=A0AAD9R8H4_9HYME|nr:hypothetical protein KPH14_008854 [Odynerus spinipes]